MKPLIFPNEEALRLALTSGLVPEEVAAAPVAFARAKDGSLKVFPAKSLGKAEARLATAGVKSGPDEKQPKDVRQARCWAEALAPRRMAGAEPGGGLVLFVLPESTSTLELGAEMLRLGCDRQDFAFTKEAAMLRAVDPPYFTVASVMDKERAMRAFVPTPPGQDHVWTELGYSHPMATSLSAAKGSLLLIGGDGEWATLTDGPWTNLYQVLELRLPGAPIAREPIASTPRLPVTLRLARATRNEPPQLWVIRENALEAIDGLVRNLSDDVLSRFLFAATGDEKKPIVVLRSRPGRGGPAEIIVTGESYVPLMQIGNVFVPHDATVEPPLRREKLRELLAPKEERVAWLAPREGSKFELESLPETAFHPLSDWVDYVVHSRAEALLPWVRNVQFSFEAFESVGAEWADERPKKKDEDEKENRSKQRGSGPKRKDDDDEEPPPPPMPVPETKTPARPTRATESVAEFRLAPSGKEEQQLAKLEREFTELDAPADDDRRASMWLEMASLNATLNRARDAGLCWTRSLWEASGKDAIAIADQWARGEAYLQRKESPDATARDLLGRKSPGREDTRALAAQVFLAAVREGSVPSIANDVHRVQVWLDTHDDNLDVRSLWLARAALAKLVGGDRLALARTRDRILAKLHRGLSLERDVPTFLRFLGQSGGKEREGSGTARLTEVLEELLTRFEKTERKRSAVEAPPALTKAYVHLIFSYGFARLGQAERARAMRTTALGALDAKDSIHRLLSRSYAARIDQALEGLPVETPMPMDIQQELNGLEKFLRYKVDRLRQASTILEPQESLDPTSAFQRGDRDPRGEEFAPLRGMTDSARLSDEIDRLLRHAMAADTPPVDSARLFDGLMDFFPILPEAQALPKLMALLRDLDDIEPPRRALLLEEALMLAGYFGRGDLVRDIVSTLKELFEGLSEEHATEIGGRLGRCLRSLRRVGLKAEAADLLQTIAKAVASQGASSLVARLNLAAGLAYLGQLEKAKPVIDEAFDALKAATFTTQTTERLQMVRTLAGALSQTPSEYAVAGIMRLADHLKGVTDSFNQNSHFCLSVLHFMESLVLGLASEDLALGEFGRRWLDEDEYLVRRRVHRELGGNE